MHNRLRSYMLQGADLLDLDGGICYRNYSFNRMPKTFDYYRSLNSRLHATLDQEQSYEKYLKRIDSIVSKKPVPDLSSSFYMRFANRCHQRSFNHRSQEQLTQIASENQILFDKIIKAKQKTVPPGQDSYQLPLHQKRIRELERINEENRKIAVRVIQQTSSIHPLTVSSQKERKQSARRLQEKTFYQSRLKDRKLPKLIDMRS